MVKVIDGGRELLTILGDYVTYSCVVFAVVTMLVTLSLVGGYKIFFPTAVEANTNLGQTWGVILLIAIIIMTIVIDVIVGFLIKEKDLIIRCEDVSRKKVVLVRAISFTRKVRNRSYSVYIPGYHRKSFRIVSMTCHSSAKYWSSLVLLSNWRVVGQGSTLKGKCEHNTQRLPLDAASQ
jgi:hypothetical protein